MNNQCKCGGKLTASDNLLLSMPPQREYICDKCGATYYEGAHSLINQEIKMNDDTKFIIREKTGGFALKYTLDTETITIAAPDPQRENIFTHNSDGSLTIKVNRQVNAE